MINVICLILPRITLRVHSFRKCFSSVRPFKRRTINYELLQLKLMGYVMQSQRHVSIIISACPDVSQQTML